MSRIWRVFFLSRRKTMPPEVVSRTTSSITGRRFRRNFLIPLIGLGRDMLYLLLSWFSGGFGLRTGLLSRRLLRCRSGRFLAAFLLAQQRPEHTVYELRGIISAEGLGQLHGLIDDDLGRYVGLVLQFVQTDA